MTYLKKAFDSNFTALAARVLALKKGVAAIYQIDLPDSNFRLGGATEEIIAWLTQLQEMVLRIQQMETVQVFTVQIPITTREVGSETEFELSHEVDFMDSEMSGCRLRGISLELIGAQKSPGNFVVYPPIDVNNSGSYSDRKLHVGRVMQSDPSSEINPEHAEYLWNFSPNGRWHFAGKFTERDVEATALLVHFWLALA